MLHVAGVVDAAGEQHDARARHVGVGDQRVAQLGREPGQRGDVAELLGAEQLVGDAEHRRAIEQRVAEPGRRVREVLHDSPRAVGQLDHVDGVRGQPARRGWRADGADAVAPRRAERFPWHDAVAYERAGPVEVGEHGLEHGHACRHHVGQPVEGRCVEHQRHRIDAPRPTAGLVGTHVHLVHEMAGPRRHDHSVGLGLASDERGVITQEVIEQCGGRGHGTAWC